MINTDQQLTKQYIWSLSLGLACPIAPTSQRQTEKPAPVPTKTAKQNRDGIHHMIKIMPEGKAAEFDRVVLNRAKKQRSNQRIYQILKRIGMNYISREDTLARAQSIKKQHGLDKQSQNDTVNQAVRDLFTQRKTNAQIAEALGLSYENTASKIHKLGLRRKDKNGISQ